MADTFDVIICGAGSGGGFLAGEIAKHGSLLILDAGPYIPGEPAPGFGAPERRKYSTQINLGKFIPDGIYSFGRGDAFFAYPLYTDRAHPNSSGFIREARVVGGGSFINVGAWVRPRLIDWDDFAKETGVVGWSKEKFEPHFQRAERVLTVHRNYREHWNAASVLYEKAAQSMGIRVFETASNRSKCILCGQRNNAGMPCKYDSLMSTAITQIPKAIADGAVLVDNATVLKVELAGRKATGVTYRKDGKTVTAHARKLVVLSAGAIGTPLILTGSGIHVINDNVGKFLRAHPGLAIEAIVPGRDWNSERGYQWNCHHFTTDDEKGEPMDALVHASASFPTTPWLAAQVGTFGKPYKDIMRQWPQRIGVFVFHLKPGMVGRVLGTVDVPVVRYFMVDGTGRLDQKILTDIKASLKQVAKIFERMGAIHVFPDPNLPDEFVVQDLTFRVPATGLFHPQGTCRAGADKKTSVVDSNLMSHDIENLMCCDASVIPKDLSANSNAMTMAVGSFAADFVITQVLGRKLGRSQEAEQGEGAVKQ